MSQSDSPRRHILLLLATLIPLLFALRWVASKFPTSIFDCWPHAVHVEPGKLAYFIESYHSRHRYSYIRVFAIDLDKESMNEILCPSNVAPMWHDAVGIDVHGNVICRTRFAHGYEYYCCNPKSGEARIVLSTEFRDATLIGKRFLSQVVGMNESKYFFWHDLTEHGFPPHQKQLDDPVEDNLVDIPESNSFYWISRDYPQSAQLQVDEEDASSETMEMADSESLQTLDFEEMGPPYTPPAPDESLVLMGISPEGPYEIARWPVVGGSGNASYHVGDGCVGCLSMDRKFINIHDAHTGTIRHQIVVPPSALDADLHIADWRMYGPFVSLHDGAGACTSVNTNTGAAYDTSNSLQGLVIGFHDDEYLTLLLKKHPDDWPGVFEVRSSKSGKVVHSWITPDWHMAFGWPPSGNVQFTPDGREITFVTQDGRILAVDKATGKIVSNIRPRFWVPYLTSLAAIGTFIWGVYWMRLSIRMGFSFWFDIIVFILLCYLFLWWRITLAGCHEDYDRIAWKCVVALQVALGTLIVHQTLYAKRGLVFRMLPSFVFGAVSIIAIRHLAEPGWVVHAQTTYAILVSTVVIVGSILTHRICPPFSPANSLGRQLRKNDFTLSLRQLLFITFVCAAIMAALRLIDWKWTLEIVWREGIAFGIIGCIVLLMYCAVLCRGLLWLKSTVAITLIAAVAVVCCHHQAWWDLVIFESVAKWSESIAILGFATILVASPIALRQRPLSKTKADQNGA